MNKISIIIPVYNSVKFLNACLDSIIRQTYQNMEIILVDDGSTDGSSTLCDEWGKKDSRIRTLHQKNQGVSAARNYGLKFATGNLISFVDSDDTLENDMYEKLIDTMLKYKADIAHCGYKRMNENGEIIKEVSGSHIILEQDSEEAIQYMLEGKYFVGGLWNKLYTYDSIKNLQFCIDLKNNEDVLFNVLAFQNANRIVFVDETKYCYYEHSSSACNQMQEERQIRDSAYAAQLMNKCCKKMELQNVIKKWSFDTRCNLYRFLILHKKDKTNEQKELRNWLRKNYYTIKNMGVKSKINYYLLVYGTVVYRILYSVYDTVRKPNWDVK